MEDTHEDKKGQMRPAVRGLRPGQRTLESWRTLEKPGGRWRNLQGHKPNPEDIWRTLTRPKRTDEPNVRGPWAGQRTLEKVEDLRETWRTLEKPGGLQSQIRRTFETLTRPRTDRALCPGSWAWTEDAKVGGREKPGGAGETWRTQAKSGGHLEDLETKRTDRAQCPGWAWTGDAESWRTLEKPGGLESLEDTSQIRRTCGGHSRDQRTDRALCPGGPRPGQRT